MNVTKDNKRIKTIIKNKAIYFGFASIGIAQPNLSKMASDNLGVYLSNDWHGDMNWMLINALKRKKPKYLWPDVKSIIVLTMSYSLNQNPLESLNHRNQGVISTYAKGEDYHIILKKRLKQFSDWLVEEYDCNYRIYVDTAPVMEKSIAESSGIGWQGKHTNILSRDFGNWLLIGSVFTTLDLESDKASSNHCGKCNACQTICPTNAFIDEYKLDSRKCISYLTIEYKGHIPIKYRAAIGNRIYGCDDCLAVCPWNKFAKLSSELSFYPRIELDKPNLNDLLKITDSSFRTIFKKSPIKRIGRDRFIRNVLIAAGNSKDRNIKKDIEFLLKDKSTLVRAMAVWAIHKITTKKEFESLRDIHISKENDNQVRLEWFG